MNSLVRLSAGLLLLALAAPFVYLLAALLLAAIPANPGAESPSEGIVVRIMTNGVHADVVLPAIHPVMDWTARFPPDAFPQPGVATAHIGFGWGDVGFYRDAPTWNDLQLKTALQALFLRGPAAMHVSYYVDPMLYPGTREVMLSETQYRRLVDYILASFVTDDVGRAFPLAELGYGYNDAFFQATGSYSLFNTCNQWTGNALRHAGVRVGYWTPFDFNVVQQLE